MRVHASAALSCAVGSAASIADMMLGQPDANAGPAMSKARAAAIIPLLIIFDTPVRVYGRKFDHARNILFPDSGGIAENRPDRGSVNHNIRFSQRLAICGAGFSTRAVFLPIFRQQEALTITYVRPRH